MKDASRSSVFDAGVSAPLVRGATQNDLNAIMDIEFLSFSTPWSKEAMAQEIGGRDWSRVMVAEMDGEIAGFMVYWVVVGEIHLLNLAVHPELRRRGVGSSLVRFLLDLADSHQIMYLLLEVRVSNKAAQSLYRNFGFKPVTIRQSYYTDNGEDAIVMCIRRNT